MLTQTTFVGFTAWELRDDKVRLIVLPEWGGKIAVLEDRARGRGRVHLSYHLTNLSPHEIAFLWSSHPLLAITPGMKLDISVDRLWQNGQSEPLTWPWVEGLDCRRIPDPSVGRAMKLFATLTSGRVTLTDPTAGARLTFSFDTDQITHLGLWLNYGGWAGVPDVPPYFNLGLEPCIGEADSLADAVHHNLGAGRLRPHASHNWSLQLQVE